MSILDAIISQDTDPPTDPRAKLGKTPVCSTCDHREMLPTDEEFATGAQCTKEAKWSTCFGELACDEHRCRCKMPIAPKATVPEPAKGAAAGLDLEAIRARAEAATSPPWRYVHGYGFSCHTSMDGPPTNNTDFIIHAREDIPALLAEIERLSSETNACILWNTPYPAEARLLSECRKQEERAEKAESEIVRLTKLEVVDAECEMLKDKLHNARLSKRLWKKMARRLRKESRGWFATYESVSDELAAFLQDVAIALKLPHSGQLLCSAYVSKRLILECLGKEQPKTPWDQTEAEVRAEQVECYAMNLRIMDGICARAQNEIVRLTRERDEARTIVGETFQLRGIATAVDRWEVEAKSHTLPEPCDHSGVGLVSPEAWAMDWIDGKYASEHIDPALTFVLAIQTNTRNATLEEVWQAFLHAKPDEYWPTILQRLKTRESA